MNNRYLCWTRYSGTLKKKTRTLKLIHIMMFFMQQFGTVEKEFVISSEIEKIVFLWGFQSKASRCYKLFSLWFQK